MAGLHIFILTSCQYELYLSSDTVSRCELKKFSGQLSEKINSIKADGFQKKQGCRIKADHELEDKKRIPMSIVFVVWWCLCVLGRTDLSPSSDEQMPTTDTTQDMGILFF